MNYRQSNLLAAESIMTSGTKTLEINVRDIISRIVVIIRGTNDDWTAVGHPALIASKIELVDGADVLFSLRGVYAQAVSFYGTKIQPFNYINYTDHGTCVACMPIDFGRYLYDPELALDPNRFHNLQLKIAHDESLGGCDLSACTLEVWADLFDEKVPSPRGFLQSQSIWSKTWAKTLTDYIELPTDMPIRLVMPAAFSNLEEPDINIDSVKITEDHDKKVVIDAGVLELLQMFETQWPIWSEFAEGRGKEAGGNWFFTPCKDLNFARTNSEDKDYVTSMAWSGGNKRAMTVETGDCEQALQCMGRCPHGVIPIPMGRIMEIDDWWDVRKIGSARVKMITGTPDTGDVGALYELLIQQLRS